MTRTAVLFDSNALRSNANLSTLTHPSYRHFVAPKTIVVLREQAPDAYHSFGKALDARRIENLGADATGVDPPNGGSLEHADILGHASILAKDSDYSRVLIVSDNPALRQFAKDRQIDFISAADYPAEITATIAAEKAAAEKAAKEASETSRRQRAALIRESLVGLVIIAVAVVVWQYRTEIVSTVPVWGTVIGLTIAGPLLYALRGRQRLIYGIAESGIGLYSALSTVAPFVWAYGTEQPAFSSTSGITILGGLYVMVRGLDNIGTGLKGTDWEPTWRHLSGEQQK